MSAASDSSEEGICCVKKEEVSRGVKESMMRSCATRKLTQNVEFVHLATGQRNTITRVKSG